MTLSDELEHGPAVTWLLSVKNSFRFLRETLESIESQTYRNHQLLVWDDCSLDGTLEELQRWVPTRISGKIFSGRSLRLGASLAFLTEQARTEFCARIDGDDVNHPRRLERQVAYMLMHPEVGVLGSLTEHIDEYGHTHSAWNYPTADAEIRWRSRWHASLSHPTVMFRRSAVLAAGNYRDFQIEDLDLWMRMSLITELHNLPEPLVKYRRFDSSMTGQVEDFYPLELKTATLNASVLFSGIADPVSALDLWRVTHLCRNKTGHLSWMEARKAHRDCQRLRGAAISFARHAGKADNYFLNTELCQSQLYSLRRKFLESCGLSKFYEPCRRIAEIRGRASLTTPAAELQPKSAR